MITTLLFDLDDTLIVEEESAKNAFLRTGHSAALRYGIDKNEFALKARETARSLWYTLPTIKIAKEIGMSSWEGLWARFEGDHPCLPPFRKIRDYYQTAAWEKTLEVFGISDPAFTVELGALFGAERRKLHMLFPDVLPALESLMRRYKMGIVTNGIPDLQREKIAGGGLSTYFEAVSISGEVGYAKPSREIFTHALEMLNAEPGHTIMTGNSLSTDIEGAKNAGILSVWMNRAHHMDGTGVQPDRIITGLDELEGILKTVE